ncbi:MAG: pilus assembly protein [Actinobacteria bacterium]|nr:pilus assembly protein [Actinomycetota bacterium]
MTRKRIGSERGVSLIETALVLPMLLILALGVAEFGFAFIDWLSISNAARTGARIGSAAGTTATADTIVLNAVEQAVADIHSSTIQAVWIYKADSNGDPADATLGCAVGSEGLCSTSNVYIPKAGGGWMCMAVNGCPWTPALRDNRLPGLDELGVRIIFDHTWLTNFMPLPGGPWSDDSVFQLEPAQGVP